MGGKEMAEQQVARVEALWRYPVKSMLGERLERVAVGERGLCGDRAYALWDHERGRVASVKNPLRWRALLGYRAAYTAPPQAGAPPPPVAIRAPGAEMDLLSSDADTAATLSRQLGRRVSLLDAAPERASLDQYWPDVKEREFQEEVRELLLPSGTFFDACALHALSTATLQRLRQLEPGLEFAVERFRPNLLLRPVDGAEGFVEEAWIGRRLRLGERLVLHVQDGCPRCVVTTLAQGALGEDLEILRATARHNKVVAGIRLTVLEPGEVALGDAVTLLDGARP